MRTCASCQDPIPKTKRRDAKYCDKAACRGREYRKRQAEATASRTAHAVPHEYTVLACPCGRQYRLHITEIHEHEPGIAAALSPPAAISKALTQTVLLTDPQPAVPIPTASDSAMDSKALTQTVLLTDLRSREPLAQEPILIASPEALAQTVLRTDPQLADPAPAGPDPTLDSEALTRTVLLTDPRTEEPAASKQEPMPGTEALTRTDRTDPQAPRLVALETDFTNGTQRQIPFANAFHHERDGRWSLRPNVRFAFSSDDEDWRSLGGQPGACAPLYGTRSPMKHDYDPNLAVMNWDYKARRSRVASINVLRSLLGQDWRQKLREIRDGRRES